MHTALTLALLCPLRHPSIIDHVIIQIHEHLLSVTECIPRLPRRRSPPFVHESMEFDETFKILLVGDSGVGKSSILLRFTDDAFEPMQPTIGVDFKVKAMKVDNRRVKMTIWDT